MSQISLFKVFMAPNVSEVLNPVLQSGFITQGKQVEAFEKALREFFDYPYILTLNSATAGLTLALRMLNLSPGDAIISTALTCTATNWPILANGLSIKWADVDPKTCNISVSSICDALSEKTKAIMAVHWGGYPVDLNGLKGVQDYAESRFGFRPRIIEDCAHAFGAGYNGSLVGTTGNIAVFSLQAIKHLTCGDGGLIFLPNKEEYERAKLLRWYGIDRERRNSGDFRLEPDICEWGYKFHMNDIGASIGLANLPFIAKNIFILRENARMYRQRLQNVSGVELLTEDPRYESAYWLFTIKIVNKQGFIQFAKERGVMVSQVHNRNDKHSCVSAFATHLPNVDALEKSIVCIPAGWWLTDNEKEHVLNTVIEWVREINSITFRELQPHDRVQFLELMTQLNGYSYALAQSEFNTCLDEIKKTGCVMVGWLTDKIVCTGRLTIEQKFAQPVVHIEDVVVDFKHRHRGFGQKIIKHLVELAKASACYKITLDAKLELASFYKSCGFHETGLAFNIRL